MGNGGTQIYDTTILTAFYLLIGIEFLFCQAQISLDDVLHLVTKIDLKTPPAGTLTYFPCDTSHPVGC